MFLQGAEWGLKQQLCKSNGFWFSLPPPCSPYLSGWLDRDQMEEVCVAGSNLCTHRFPSDRGGPHPVQLQPLPEGGCAKCVAAQPAAGSERTLAFLVGGRPQLCRSHPPWACRWGDSLGLHARPCTLLFKMYVFNKLYRCILLTMLLKYIKIWSQGQPLNDTQDASADSLTDFREKGRVITKHNNVL